jgi:hypothetical protein
MFSDVFKDERSRADKNEDVQKKLDALDEGTLIQLLHTVQAISVFKEGSQAEFWNHKEDLENSLHKLIRDLNKTDDLNSEESRKISLKKQELELDTRHDWKEKFRLFFFRILTTTLFVISLFAIGYIEDSYEWAKLPLSKYVKTAPMVPADGVKINLSKY